MKVKSDHRSKFSNSSVLAIGKKKPEKIRASRGFEPVTSAIPVRCSTNWALKPHIGSEVSLLGSYLPVQWSDVKFIWNNSYLYCGCRWKWRVIVEALIFFALNVWLHSSVGGASHRYRGGHGFESHWSPDLFQASSFQLLKLENLLRWSLFSYNSLYTQAVACTTYFELGELVEVLEKEITMYSDLKNIGMGTGNTQTSLLSRERVNQGTKRMNSLP